MSKLKKKIYKELTRNDTGETKSHQSGITIPKKVAESGIFPQLGKDVLNPRKEIAFFDEKNNMWEFQYIYYNDVYFREDKKKSHNEHRLTCVTQYIREYGIMSGDYIWFGIDEQGVHHIGHEFKKKHDMDKKINSDGVLKLSGNWKMVRI